jgi:NAD(P)-dependent dehydrogenase (short-subunit alcohol dehydrogenase family)
MVRSIVITGASKGIGRATIAFLASKAAAFITGQTLFVDGGASLGTL